MAETGTCRLCGCTMESPCLGGVLFPNAGAAAQVHRLVADAHVLDAGETCFWLDEAETLCSAHTDDELARDAAVDHALPLYPP